MNKNFLRELSFNQIFILEKAKEHNIDIDFRNVKYIFDLCIAYSFWPEKAYWKEVFEKVVEMSLEDINNPKTLNKVKQWTNRHFSQAIKYGLIQKLSSQDDKRVVIFEWTKKGKEFMKSIINK